MLVKLLTILKTAKRINYGLREYGRQHGFGTSLSGLCAIGSHTLRHALLQQGIDGDCICGDDLHVWYEHQGFVIDITATQFNTNLPLVFFTKPSHHLYRQYVNCINCNNIVVLDHWPCEQQPIADAVDEVLSLSEFNCRSSN